MEITDFSRQLKVNRHVFRAILQGVSVAMQTWRPASGGWCMLEIVNHLLDEEKDDFRARIRFCLESPEAPFIPIDPVGWVQSRSYLSQNYQKSLEEFLKERDNSLQWLSGLKHSAWDLSCKHPLYGSMTAGDLLANWVAHDYHHIRQINNLKYEYLKKHTETDLGYAGKW